MIAWLVSVPGRGALIMLTAETWPSFVYLPSCSGSPFSAFQRRLRRPAMRGASVGTHWPHRQQS